MVDLAYKNVRIRGADNIEEARRLAAIAILRTGTEAEPSQAEIDALAAEIEAEQARRASLATSVEDGKAWFAANPNAKLLFSLSLEDLETEVNDLVDALFPTATAGQRTKTKLLWMAEAVAIRVLATELGLLG